MARLTISGSGVYWPNQAAVPWGRSNEVRYPNEHMTGVFFREYIIGAINPMVVADRRINPESLNANAPGVTPYLMGDDPFPTTSSSIELKASSKGSYKEWVEAKKSGRIVLKPMLAYKMQASGTPSISSAAVYNGPTVNFTYDRYVGSVKQPGVEFRSYYSVPALQVDSDGNWASVNTTVYEDPYVARVPEELLESLMLDIVSHLGRSSVNSELVTKVVAEANSAQFDIATEIGEMPETIKMILKFIKEGIKLLLRFRKEVKQNLSTGSVGKDAASMWMGYRYGLMPIVYSINDGLDLLSMEARKFQSFRGRSDFPAEEFSARGYECISAPQVQHRCFLKYGYDLESVINQGLKINLLSTAWELVPLSFVWDWFFSIGDYLSALLTPSVVNQIGSTYSYKVNGTYVFKNDKGSIINITVDYYKVNIIKPQSHIGINSDVFISWKRAMDAIALSWLIFKKNPS